MSLAERFKKHIEANDIFKNTEKNITEQKGNSVKFISKPTNKDETVEPLDSNVPATDVMSKTKSFDTETLENVISRKLHTKETTISSNRNILEETNSGDVETVTNELLTKIAKTPYWNEFSNIRKEKMIKTYFEKRIPENKNNSVSDSVIQDILIKTTK